MTSSATQRRRDRVLIEPADVTARKLRESPGQWFLIAVGYPDEEYSLGELARILAQTAYRIRQNYRLDKNQKRQGLRAFAADSTGEFDAQSTADQTRANPIAPVEMTARFVLYDSGEPRNP